MGSRLAPSVERIETGSLRTNCYVVGDSAGDAVIVDPGDDFGRIADFVADRNLTPRGIVATHAHADHIGAAAQLAEEWEAPFHLHSADAGILLRANFYRRLIRGKEAIRIPTVDVDLDGMSRLRFGGLTVGVIHTPGHTPGGVCFELEGELFTGDTLMSRHVGRTDFPGGDSEDLKESVALIAERCPATTVLRPGHGEPALLGDVAPRIATLPELREK
jgi:hydroxyacylglutathione hydrolase